MNDNILNYLNDIDSFTSLPEVYYRDNNDLEYIFDFIKQSSIFEINEDETIDNEIHNNGFREKAITKETVSEPEKEDSSSVKSMIDTCSRCEGAAEKKYPFGTGNSGIMTILNAPVLMSKLEIIEYRNAANDMMKKIFENVLEKNIKDIYITNIIKCEPGSLIEKPSTFFHNCERILKKEIDSIKPHTVLIMGDMLPLKRIIKSYKNINWYNIDHPVTMAKHSELKIKAFETLKILKNDLGKN